MPEIPQWVKDYWWVLSAFVALVIWLIKMAVSLHVMKMQFLKMQRDLRRLFGCNFVILDGLKKLGCNGAVTTEYEAMRTHVLDEHGYGKQEKKNH